MRGAFGSGSGTPDGGGGGGGGVRLSSGGCGVAGLARMTVCGGGGCAGFVRNVVVEVGFFGVVVDVWARAG